MNWRKVVSFLVGNFGKSDSVTGDFNKKDALKTLRTSVLAGVGAVVAHWLGFFETVDWGLLETVSIAGLTAVFEAVQRVLKNNSEE